MYSTSAAIIYRNSMGHIFLQQQLAGERASEVRDLLDKLWQVLQGLQGVNSIDVSDDIRDM